MSPHDAPAAAAEYHPHPDILFTALDESEAVLLSLPASRYYALNETGILLWRALADGATLPRLARALEDGYEVTHEQALAHARAFVGDLAREGLIEEIGAGDRP